MKCPLCMKESAWSFGPDDKERIACEACRAVFVRVKPYDGAGDLAMTAAAKTINSVMLRVRVCVWALTNMERVGRTIFHEFQRTAIEGWLDDSSFRDRLREHMKPKVDAVEATTNASGSNDIN